MTGSDGVMAMERSKAGGFTFRVVVPEELPSAAVIVVEPAATAVALPSWVMLAVESANELQVA